MPGNSGIVIRKFEIKDREAVRRIACETAFMGKPASIFFDGDGFLADALTLYFTDYEPESCFVAESANEVIGYLTGAKDTSVLRRVFNSRILPRLFLKAFAQGILARKKNIIFIFNMLSSFLKNEFKEPDFSDTYPATLHINIKEGFRGFGVGAKLISAYTDYLIKEKVRGVHLATISEAGNNFFNKEGFELLYKGSRSYFRYILDKVISISIYGKRLSA